MNEDSGDNSDGSRNDDEPEMNTESSTSQLKADSEDKRSDSANLEAENLMPDERKNILPAHRRNVR